MPQRGRGDVSRCELDRRQCLWEHARFKAKARGGKPEGDSTSINLLCPAHDDRKRSLTISVADHEGKRLVWYCHAGCPDMAVRDALITRYQISPGCLPIPRNDTIALLEAAIAELKRPGRDHAQKVIRTLAAALGYKEVPHGAELERLAGRAGVGRRSAFKAAGRQPDNQ
jgi:hypothetical protein